MVLGSDVLDGGLGVSGLPVGPSSVLVDGQLAHGLVEQISSPVAGTPRSVYQKEEYVAKLGQELRAIGGFLKLSKGLLDLKL